MTIVSIILLFITRNLYSPLNSVKSAFILNLIDLKHYYTQEKYFAFVSHLKTFEGQEKYL